MTVTISSPQMTPSQLADWDMVAEVLTYIGTLSIPILVAMGLPLQYSSAAGLLIMLCGGLGHRLIDKLNTTTGRGQIVTSQQQVIAILQKIAALPPEQQAAMLKDIPAFLQLLQVSGTNG